MTLFLRRTGRHVKSRSTARGSQYFVGDTMKAICGSLAMLLAMSGIAIAQKAVAHQDAKRSSGPVAVEPSDGGGEAIPPWVPNSISETLGRTIQWTLTSPLLATESDSIWLRSVITNFCDHRIGFAINSEPSIELKSPDGEVLIWRLQRDNGMLRRYSCNRLPGPGEPFHCFEVDLRAIFGRLKAGKYQVQVNWDVEGYKVQGSKEDKAVRLRSPVQAFQIVSTTLADASRSLEVRHGKDWSLSRKADERPGADKPFSVGKLTNHFKTDIFVPYVPALGAKYPDPVKLPLRAPMQLSRWYGSGWREVTQEVDPGPRYTLKPGESVEILITDWMIDGDGIYSFSVSVFNSNESFIADVVCPPFRIDQVPTVAEPRK
jgi:hypothetical protein